MDALTVPEVTQTPGIIRAHHAPTLRSSTAAVYLTYDPTDPPPHPGPSWTRFVCIYAGDLSNGGKLKYLQTTIDWLKMLPHPVKMRVVEGHLSGR